MANDETSRPFNKRLIPLIVGGALLIGYGGYRLYQSRQPYEWSGTIEARTIAVGSRTGGRIKAVMVREGDLVQAGQPLLELETGDLKGQLLAAHGQLDQAKANLAKLEKGARPEEIQQAKARALTAEAALSESRTGARGEQIRGARARLAAAQVALEKAQLDEGRMKKLIASGAASQAEADNAQIQLKSEQAQRDAIKEQLDELTNGSRKEDVDQAAARALEAQASAKLVLAGSRVEDIAAAQGVVEEAQGKVQSIETAVDELFIRAPRTARVEACDLRPGDILGPSATAATLLEEDQLYVRIYVPETQLGHIVVGQAVPVTVDSFNNRDWKGVVEHINAVGEYSPRNLQTADERADQVFATRIGLHDTHDQLRAGMAAFIRVPK